MVTTVFPRISDSRDLAIMADVEHSFISAVIDRKVDPYTEFYIHKRAKKMSRAISAPAPELAKMQRWLLCNVLDSYGTGQSAYAYQKGRSIAQCAGVHVGASWLIKLDLQAFFHSINEDQVFKVFRRNYDDRISRYMARIATRGPLRAKSYESLIDAPDAEFDERCDGGRAVLGYLPQGAPTSGALANHVAEDLDKMLRRIAMRSHLRYSRYSDDLVFSSTDEFTRKHAIQIIRKVRSVITAHGFQVNEKKIKISPPGTRLVVLGLLVDGDRVRLSREFKRRLGWHVYGVAKFGFEGYCKSQEYANVDVYVSHVDGLFHHAVDVEPAWANSLYKEWREMCSFWGVGFVQ